MQGIEIFLVIMIIIGILVYNKTIDFKIIQEAQKIIGYL